MRTCLETSRSSCWQHPALLFGRIFLSLQGILLVNLCLFCSFCLSLQDKQSGDFKKTDQNERNQAVVIPQVVDSAEGILNGHEMKDGTAAPTESGEEDPYGTRQNSSRQALSRQQPTAQQPAEGQQFAAHGDSQQYPGWEFASRRDADHPQSQAAASQGRQGHLQQPNGASPERLSSRRRSMERPSASLTLPFEQLNFAFHHINYSVPATVSHCSCPSTLSLCLPTHLCTSITDS